MKNLYAILLAGGTGTRLWPVSRKNTPKQLQPILGKDTLLKATWNRLRAGLPASRILIVTNAFQADLIRKDLPELPEENLLIEPMKRDTATAVGFGVEVARARDPEALIMTVNSDAHIRDEKEYWRIVKLAARDAKLSKKVTLIGVRPTYPETGYGYIKMGSQARRVPRKGGAADEIFEVEGFREKPNLKTAKDYVSKWEYLWNPTLLVSSAEVLMKEFRIHLPGMYKELEKVRKGWETPKADKILKDAFSKIDGISIDYGILEKVKGMRVVPADFGWADVGHWRAVHDVLASKPSANVKKGKHVSVDSKGNLLYSFSGKLIATAGLEDMILIETEDVILCCPKDRAQDVKKIVTELEKKNLKKHL